MQNRREFLRNTAILTAGLCIPNSVAFAFADKKQRYKIAVIDLMILKRQKLSALPLAKELGADGLEVDMGGLGNRETFDSQLSKPEVVKQYLDKAKELDLEICSIAMTGFYAQSFATRPTYQRMVQDCIDTMKALNVKVAFLPLGIKGDLVKNPELFINTILEHLFQFLKAFYCISWKLFSFFSKHIHCRKLFNSYFRFVVVP